MPTDVKQNAEVEIRSLIERWAKAVRAQDIDGVLADHAEDMLMFDVPPPVQVCGIEGLPPDMAAVLRMAEGRCSFRHRVARSYGWRRCRVRNRIASLRHDRGIREGPATAPPPDSGTAQGGRSLDHRA